MFQYTLEETIKHQHAGMFCLLDETPLSLTGSALPCTDLSPLAKSCIMYLLSLLLSATFSQIRLDPIIQRVKCFRSKQDRFYRCMLYSDS